MKLPIDSSKLFLTSKPFIPVLAVLKGTALKIEFAFNYIK